MHRFKTHLAIATALTLAASALAQKPKIVQTEEKSRLAIAGASIEQDPNLAAQVQRFQTDFGVNIKLAHADDAEFAKNHVVTSHVADEGRGDQPFLAKLETDKILKNKAERLIEFFQLLKHELAIPAESPFYSKLQGVSQAQMAK